MPEIDISLIDVPGKNPRGVMNDDHVIELSGNMARNGLLEPIGLQKEDSGRYTLLFGFHRLAAAMRIGWKKIPANVRDENGTPATVLSLCENLIRKEMSLQEEIEAVKLLTQVELLSPSQICDFLNRSRAWVDRRLMAPYLPEAVRVKLWEGLINLTQAELIGNIEPEGTRNDILNRCIYGKLTTSQLSEVIDIYENAPSMAEAVRQGVEAAAQVQTPPTILRPCAFCGTLQPGTEIIFVPVCRQGCPRKESEKK